MPRISQWELNIGRRLRLRDLFVFFTVLECGSLSKAAQRLGVSTPSVSERIADLEHTVGARLLERSPKGVVATRFGEALLKRGQAAFDELQQGIRDIESIADPASGEVRIGCPESTAAFLVLTIEHVARKYPRMRFVVQQVHAPTVVFPELLARKIDLVLARLVTPPTTSRLGEDFDAEVLFDDPFCAVVGKHSKWARRRTIELANLTDERWLLPSLDALAGLFVTDAFAAQGLKPPTPNIASFSIHLRSNLASRGDYVAVLPHSFMRLSGSRYELSELPVKLSDRPSPVAVVTLRNRSLTPAVQVFMQSAREVATQLFNKTGTASTAGKKQSSANNGNNSRLLS